MTSVRDAGPQTETVAAAVFRTAAAEPDRVALRYQVAGQWRDETFAELAETVRALAAGLVETGMAPGDRICVLATTSPEWTYLSLAVLAAGAVVVPIYPSSSVPETAWVLDDSEATTVFYDSAAQREKLLAAVTDLVRRPELVAIGTGGGPTMAGLIGRGRAALADPAPAAPVAAELDRRLAAIRAADLAEIIYTSGTTGPAKGCMLTHGNWVSLCEINTELGYLTGDDVAYLFLPLAHVFGQMILFCGMSCGSTLAIFGGDVGKVVTEIAEVRPTYLPSAPRIFEKLYTALTAGLDPETLAEAVRVGLAVRERHLAGEPLPDDLVAAADRFEPLFTRTRAAFGGRVRLALSGGAPIAAEVLRFFYAAGVAVVEGYGMTETTGLGTTNAVDDFRHGSVGRPAPRVRMRIAEDGEILVRGPHVFAGYWRNPQATAEVMVDGWLHTGDLGVRDPDGFITITGRKKDIIITAGGKNIAPANLENDLRQSRWISHAVMYGDRRPYPVALITLDQDEIAAWAGERGRPADLPSLAGDPEVVALIQEVVDAANGKHATATQIKRFAILDRDLTMDSGELTASMKIRRGTVHANHAALLESLYA